MFEGDIHSAFKLRLRTFKKTVDCSYLRQQSAGKATALVLPYWGRSNRSDPEKKFQFILPDSVVTRT